jgi:hypothetical protein
MPYYSDKRRQRYRFGVNAPVMEALELRELSPDLAFGMFMDGESRTLEPSGVVPFIFNVYSV